MEEMLGQNHRLKEIGAALGFSSIQAFSLWRRTQRQRGKV
jgi:hypothetical protein